MPQSLPVIAIVGRPNVGKSTLFNRLIGHRSAIVHNTPGVTRDRHYDITDRYGYSVMIVDTGGFEPHPEDQLFRNVRAQALAAVREADVVLFVVDSRAGLNPLDEEVGRVLRTVHSKVLLVINKVEGGQQRLEAAEFYALGFETLHLVSAEHDHGITDLMDEVYLLLGPGPVEEDDEDDDSGAIPEDDEAYEDDEDAVDEDSEDEDSDDEDSEDEDSDDEGSERESAEDSDDDEGDEEDDDDALDEDWQPELDEAEAPAPTGKRRLAPEPDEIRIAVLGRPNVGKSTLVNRLIGEERQVVSDKPGTTMDAIDLPLETGGRKFVLVDTAGIRRKARIETDLEGFAISRSLRAIERCHVVLMVLDGDEGVSEQDARLLQVVLHRGRAVILLVNKWDLVRDDPERDITVLEKELGHRMPHAPWAPVLYISAKSGKGVSRILPMVEEVFKAFNQRLTTAECNRFLRAAVLAHSVPQRHHRPVRINYMTQIRVRPPTFVLWCNVPEGVDEAYKRYLSNRLREAYGFKGTSLRLFFRRKRRPGEPLPGEHMV
ncbi:MAG: hypothetical protein RIT28_2727 [Pseudomonadota bacterium]